MRRRIRRTGLVALAGAILASGLALGQVRVYTVESPFDWPTSSPGSQGVDPATIDRALEAGEALPFLQALLVIKSGVLIGERYYGDIEPTDATTVMSVSKSVLSALVGIARDQELLELDQPILDFFPEYAADVDPRVAEVTIRHLLTMTAGYPPDDYGLGWARWLASRDWVGYCLAQPLVDDPGEAWHYSTCSTHIASAIISRSTGTTTRRFAEENLFGPLGIEIARWPRDRQGVHRGGWDMFFTPRDIARFGALYLGKGKLDGERIVSRRWVRRTTRTNVRGAGEWGALPRWGYGHWWWTGNGPEIYKMYFALGYGGQYVINVPKLDLTLVATANPDVGPAAADLQERTVLGVLIDNLLEPLREESAGARADQRQGSPCEHPPR